MRSEDLMEGSHLEFAAAETASLSASARWLAWLRKAAKAAGVADLDGDDAAEGYSLNAAHDAFERGETAAAYGEQVRVRLASGLADGRGASPGPRSG